MEKFRYLTSADHLAWYVPDGTAVEVYLSAEKLDGHAGKRYEIRTWVESNCRGRVWAWNNTRTPIEGQTGWGRISAPQGDISMFFEEQQDMVLFKLTWG